MARKSRKGHRGGSKKLPISIVAPMAMGGYFKVVQPLMAGNQILAVANLTGFDMGSTADKWKPQYLVGTYGPILAGAVIHKVAGRVGVNRMIPKWLPVSI